MIENSRYERKWVFQSINKTTLLSYLICSDLSFEEKYNERYVNSIYFDSLTLKSASDNLAGNRERVKYRIRWYGKNKNVLLNPVLECKIKNGFYGYKKYFNIDNFDQKIVNYKNLNLLTDKVNLVVASKNLHPVSATYYKRTYLISSDNLIRATIDDEIMYKNIFNKIDDFFICSNKVILEMKYPTNIDNFLKNKFRGITRISKNSKYLNSLLNSNFY